MMVTQQLLAGSLPASLLVAAVAVGSLVGEAGAAPPKPPNIVMLFTDDQRHDAVGYRGNTAVSTPHLDRLARRGIVFENAFVNTSICCVSRANLLSGQYPSRHGITDFHKPFSPAQLRRTVPARLRRAGYQTALFGKWGIGDSAERTAQGAAAFDYWAGQPMQTCFFHGSACRYVNSDGFNTATNNLCDCPTDAAGRPGFRNRIGKEGLKDPLHVDADVTPKHVERFLAGRDKSKPFCLMLFFKAPHSPFQDWDPEFADVTKGLVMPRPAGATMANAMREPDVVKNSLGRPSGMQYLKRPKTLDTHLRDYYRLISSMDAGVGRVMELIEKERVADNTVVLFTSDNGHFKGEHGLAGKWLMHEPSLRVPGFIYDPRRPGGIVSRRMVITTDFSVTTLSLAGVKIPGSMTGRDLTKLYDDPHADWRDDFYYDHPYGHKGKLPRMVGVRNAQYAYMRYTDPTPPFEQLFDLHSDPNQLVSLVDDPRHAGTLRALRDRCDDLATEVGSMDRN